MPVCVLGSALDFATQTRASEGVSRKQMGDRRGGRSTRSKQCRITYQKTLGGRLRRVDGVVVPIVLDGSPYSLQQ